MTPEEMAARVKNEVDRTGEPSPETEGLKDLAAAMEGQYPGPRDRPKPKPPKDAVKGVPR